MLAGPPLFVCLGARRMAPCCARGSLQPGKRGSGWGGLQRPGAESCLTGHPPRGPCVARPLRFKDPDSWILM